jgi:heptosyltransferase-2
MCEPALASLRALFPSAEITLLVKSTIAELFKGHPGVDRIFVYEDRGRHAGLVGKWALAGALRRARFNLAILFQNAFEAAFLTFLAGIPQRYGYATDGRGLLLSDPIPVPGRARIGHQVRYYMDLLQPLGAVDPPRAPRLFLSPEEQESMGRRLALAGIAEPDFVIGVNPGSVYGSAKRWPPERFAETADRLVREYEDESGRAARIVIVGGRGEETLGNAVAVKMRHRPVVLSGHTTIRELMAAIKRCGLFLTNDTGPMHIAAAFEIPLVAVFGPTDARVTSPFGAGHTIVRQSVDCSPCLLRECPIDHRCMTRVTVAMVYEAATAQLGIAKSERRESESRDMKPFGSSDLSTSLKGITVFFDRDGTLNRDTGYVRTPVNLDVFPGAVKAVARLKRAGARVVVVTNQSGIARGLLTTTDLETIHTRLRDLFAAGDAPLDAIYFCPHHPDEGCTCRKPEPAMVDRATVQLGLDPSGYYLVGDQRRDIEMGRRIGARSILVTTGPSSLESLAALRTEGQEPDHVASGLDEAVDWIFEDAKSRQSSARNPQLPDEASDKPSVLRTDG